MNAAAFTGLTARLTGVLAAHGFRAVGLDERGLPAVLATAWRRRAWKGTRAVAMLGVRGTQRPHELAAAVRLEVGRRIGFVPWVHPVHLHLVVVGDRPTTTVEALEAVLVRDDARCALVDVHVHGEAGPRWAVGTGAVHDALAAALARG